MLAGTMPDRGLFEATTGVPVGHVEVAIAYSHVPATPDLAATFGVEEGTKLLCRRYIFAVDGKPHQITHSYLLADMVEGTPLADPDNEQPGRGTLAQLHDIGALPEYATIDIYARMPTPDEAATLGMTEGTPVLVDRRRGLFSGKVVFVADGVAPADQVKVGLDIRLAQL
ncbi:UTRA domain-containing protein [Hamadaea sp. NPDC050747]|uniref:UTRA domain-containing protein n=1 Tax=Hamadaea sp. NPDC050747 TaxID=3155789 RepID=UPI0033F82D7C